MSHKGKHAKPEVIPDPKIVNGAYDFKTVNKAHFKCFQLPDGSVYYGEYAYQSIENKDAIYYNLEDVPVPAGEDQSLEAREKLVSLVRHKFGIQIYGRNAEAGNRLSFYSGLWNCDHKHGVGSHMAFPDGASSFTGNYRNNEFNGKGTLIQKVTDGTSSGQHVYNGEFRDGMLDGQGTFEHGLTKQKFSPQFQFNHFVSTGGAFSKGQTHHEKLDMKRTFHSQKLLLDLFNLPTSKALEDFINHVNHHRQESEKMQREQNEKVKVFRVASNISELHDALAQTKADKRTAVIISSLESKMQFEHLLNGLGGQSEVLYIRDYEQAYKNPHNRPQLKHDTRQVLTQALIQRQKLVLSLDENSPQGIPWREMYDPDISHLINEHQDPFPSQLLNHSQLADHLESLIGEYTPEIFEEGFQFIMWSKTKHISETQLLAQVLKAVKQGMEETAAFEQELLQAFKKRFEHSLPMHSVNLVFVESPAIQSFLSESHNAEGMDGEQPAEEQ